jgi:hypothetical protein
MPIKYEHFLDMVDNLRGARHYRAVNDALRLLRLIRP